MVVVVVVIALFRLKRNHKSTCKNVTHHSSYKDAYTDIKEKNMDHIHLDSEVKAEQTFKYHKELKNVKHFIQAKYKTFKI